MVLNLNAESIFFYKTKLRSIAESQQSRDNATIGYARKNLLNTNHLVILFLFLIFFCKIVKIKFYLFIINHEKKLLLLILLFSFIFINSQNCNSVFTDSGGENGNYSNNENIIITFCPENSGGVVTLQFFSFNTETAWDGMMIYNGPDTNSPIIDSGSTFNSATCPSGAWT